MTARKREVSVQRLRRAQLVTDVVNACCPWCGEPQPNPNDGSEQWMASDFLAVVVTPIADRLEPESRTVECVSCDKRMLIDRDPKATFQ